MTISEVGQAILDEFKKITSKETETLFLNSTCRQAYRLCQNHPDKDVIEFGNAILIGYAKCALFNRGWLTFIADVRRGAWALTWADDTTADFE